MSEWDWELTDTARRDFKGLDDYSRERIATKLDSIVTDEWREPAEHLEPLQGAPHDKLRIGPFRLGCRVNRNNSILYVLRIRKRGGDAYRSDDDGRTVWYDECTHTDVAVLPEYLASARYISVPSD